MNVLDVREVAGRKSTNMETIGFQCGMDALLSNDVIIKGVITDGHTGIAALMSEYIFSEYYHNDNKALPAISEWCYILVSDV